jgi:hypothetical protein
LVVIVVEKAFRQPRPAIVGVDHTADHPPSTDSVAPVMFAASSLARNTTAAATS